MRINRSEYALEFESQHEWINLKMNISSYGKHERYGAFSLAKYSTEISPTSEPSFKAFPPFVIDDEIGDALYFHFYLVKYAWNFFYQKWAEIAGPETTTYVAERFQEIFSEKYRDLVMEPFGGNTMALYIYSDKGQRIRLGDLGDGMKFLATLMILYKVTNPKWLLIDDVESHMNPRMLTLLANWLYEVCSKEKDLKLVLSTHSIEATKLIADLLEDLEPRIILLGLREEKMVSKIFKLEDIERLEKAGLDIRISEGIIL